MESTEVFNIIKKAVSESNKHFLLSYLDGNGFPHSSFMGFAHLNNNLTLVMMLSEKSRKIDILKEQPWIELVFHSHDFKYIVKFFGKAVITKSPNSIQKLLGAYEILSKYFDDGGSEALLVHLQTQLVELEMLSAGEKWHTHYNFMIEDGKLVEVDKPVLQGATFGIQEQDEGQFDMIRRLITKKHGDMLMHIIHNDYDFLSEYFSEDFTYEDGKGFNDFKTSQMELYSGITLSNSEINWGLRDFVQRKDGTVECLYFFDVTPQDKDTISQKRKEIWIPEGDNWHLLRME